MWEAYSHEVSSCGYWPGPPGDEGSSTPTPTPSRPATATRPSRRRRPLGRRPRRVRPALRAVRTAADPDALLIDFLQSTYEAAATTADWDRAALERTAGTRMAEPSDHV